MGRRLLPLLALAVTTLLALSGTSHAHNITRILAAHPEFSTFNHYLSLTHLATEINRRLTITVLAVDNSAMGELLSKHYTISTIKNWLSLHILADYFGSRKFHQVTHRSTVVASFFQATGAAPGTTGYVNVTNFKGGKVAFGAKDNNGKLDATFVKSIKEIPYNISVVQISSMLSSPEAEAPTPPPAQYNLTALMTKKGCGVFARLAATTGDVQKLFEDSVDAGLTIFCVVDAAMNKFMPKFNKLKAAEKEALLLYHGVPLYNSMQMLKTATGLTGTLATAGKDYNFTVSDTGAGDAVAIKTRIVTATVTGTVIDEQPLAIYTVNKVLQPSEIFKVTEVAPAPKAGKKPGSSPTDEADAPEGDTADQTADSNDGGRGIDGGRLSVAVVAAATVVGWVVGL